MKRLGSYLATLVCKINGVMSTLNIYKIEPWTSKFLLTKNAAQQLTWTQSYENQQLFFLILQYDKLLRWQQM